MESQIDASVLNAMRAFRRSSERQAEEKLALLRRLRRQYETGSLPTYTETQVEQSFNEQIFSKLFGYRTLLSHDERSGRHEFSVKLTVATTRRIPDFSLGSFDRGTAVTLASAELKNPDFDLDKAQAGKHYGGLTPVQQAFQAVKGEQRCRWIIVCNYRELRLYKRVDLANDLDTPPDPVVIANLHAVRDKNDLARLCAHFDRRALLGTPTLNGEPRSELMAALERHHPAAPIAAKSDHVRAVLLFTPRVEEDFALFLLERRLREAITKSDSWAKILGVAGTMSPPVSFKLAEGCISATEQGAAGTECKVSLSGLGQLQVSVSRKLDTSRTIDTTWLVEVARFFVGLVDDVFDGLSEAVRPGRASPELRDVKDVTLTVTPEHQDAALPSRGTAKTQDVLGVDFSYTPVLDKGGPLVADMVSELAIYFRAAEGGVGIDRAKVTRAWK